MRKRFSLALILILSVSLLLVRPLPVWADGTFQISNGTAIDYNQPVQVQFNGDATISRGTTYLGLQFDKSIQPSTWTDGITVTDDQGKAETWKISNVEGGVVQISRYSQALLPKGAVFHLHLKSGPDGLRATDGSTLAADIDWKLTVNDQASQISGSVELSGTLTGMHRVDTFPLRAAAGALTITLPADQDHPLVYLAVKDENGQKLLETSFATSQWDPAVRSVVLPKAGRYFLVVSSPKSQHLQVKGLELDLSPLRPSVWMDAGLEGNLALVQAPFTVRFGTGTPEATSSVSLYLDGQLLVQGAPTPGGSFSPTAVDVQNLSEGIHTLKAVGKTADGGESTQTQHFVLDRQDSFPDVPRSDWSHRYVETMAALGIVKGGIDGRFAPGRPVTRAEFAKMLALSLGLQPKPADGYFADTHGSWAAGYIGALGSAGIVKGERIVDAIYFRPDRLISRAEAAVMIARVQGLDISDSTKGDTLYLDQGSFPDWAKPAIMNLTLYHWVSGYPDRSFQPGRNLLRSETTKLLSPFLGL